MKNCLIIYNKNAGKCEICNLSSLKKVIGDDKNFKEHDFSHPLPDLSNFEEIAVCGGDGTLSTIMQKIYNLQKTVYYFPCGTLNDKGKTKIQSKENPVIGKAGNKIFTYVFATGTFTPIGYAVEQKLKKKIGVFAYILDIVKEYKIYREQATITCDDKIYDGTFTLIMFIKSPRCFGFKFNRDYRENEESGHLVAIRSPKHNGLIGKIEIFFPFFKVFFIGLKHERDGNIIFKRFKKGKLSINRITNFCADGELYVASEDIDIEFKTAECNLTVIHDLHK